MAKINVKGTEVTVLQIDNEDYISLSDMIKAKDGDFFVTSWLRNRNTLEYIGIWERVYNPNFNYVEFDIIKSNAGLNSFRVSVKELMGKTNIISLQAKTGRYGGTYVHKDIAFEFALWISPEFKIYIIKEFQRLKEEEQKSLGWSAKREYYLNYDFHKIFVISLITKILSIIKILKIKVQTDNVPQSDRLVKLNRIAIQQMQVLQDVENRKMLK